MPDYKEMYYIMVCATEDAPCVYLHPNSEMPEEP